MGRIIVNTVRGTFEVIEKPGHCSALNLETGWVNKFSNKQECMDWLESHKEDQSNDGSIRTE